MLFALTAISGSPLGAAEIDATAVLSAMGSEGRLADDIARDSRSKPEAVIPLLHIQPGATVVDVFGSGGYYSELLARVVGEEGEVWLHNSEGFEAWGINGLRDRFDSRDPGNIVRHTRSGINLDLPETSMDAAIIVMALHDIYVVPKRYNGEEYVPVGRPANAVYFLEQIYAALKPGGRFVVVEHAGDEQMESETVFDLHRMAESMARTEVESVGFRFVESSDALRNPSDDRSMIVFDSDIRGQTDRFVLSFEKPAD
ncbi:MAG: methyltransferase [Pseudohongiella sp.]|nr:MAG: methyltransferase [Pseudohongiella sp.]